MLRVKWNHFKVWKSRKNICKYFFCMKPPPDWTLLYEGVNNSIPLKPDWIVSNGVGDEVQTIVITILWFLTTFGGLNINRVQLTSWLYVIFFKVAKTSTTVVGFCTFLLPPPPPPPPSLTNEGQQYSWPGWSPETGRQGWIWEIELSLLDSFLTLALRAMKAREEVPSLGTGCHSAGPWKSSHSTDQDGWLKSSLKSWHAEYLYCKSNEDGWALTQADFWGRSVQFLKWTGGLEHRRGGWAGADALGSPGATRALRRASWRIRGGRMWWAACDFHQLLWGGALMYDG